MITYIEALENLPEDSFLEPEFIRVEVSGYSDSEIESIKTDIKDIMQGKDYTLRNHSCYHDEGKSCTSKDIS